MSTKTKAELDAQLKASTPPQTSTSQTPDIVGQVVTTKQLEWWLGQGFAMSDFKAQILDLGQIFQEKLQLLLFGKPLIIDRDENDDGKISDEEVARASKEVKKFLNHIKIQQTLFSNEGNIFQKGVGYVIVEKASDKVPTLRLAEPSFPNNIVRYGQTKIAATVYSPLVIDKVKYWIQTTYTHDKIVNVALTLHKGVTTPNYQQTKKVKLDVVNKNLPNNLQLQAETTNPFGFIPVVDISYVPTYDKSWNGYSRLAPEQRLRGLQQMLNEATRALRIELYLNRTKILVDEELIDTTDNSKMKAVIEAGVLGILKDSGGVDGEGKIVQVIQGNPKIKEYWENIINIISIASQCLKLSELSEEGADSATGEIFNKGNDVEIANALQIFRQDEIAEILTKSWAIFKSESFDETEIDTSQWAVQLIPNVIMNEAKMTEIVIQQLGAGLINMVQAKAKLDGISPTDALIELQKDDGIENPTLNAVNSFDDPKDKGEQTTGSGDEVQEGA